VPAVRQKFHLSSCADFRDRLLIGWSQITEAREGFRTTEQRINDDLHYVENWSLFLDFKIILMTAFSQQRNASTDR
jgi:lipopolysaccharide/colanic/teichoic acid biosynthesis glycosyltransferase